MSSMESRARVVGVDQPYALFVFSFMCGSGCKGGWERRGVVWTMVAGVKMETREEVKRMGGTGDSPGRDITWFIRLRVEAWRRPYGFERGVDLRLTWMDPGEEGDGV